MGEEIYKAKFTADTTELAKAAKDAESKLNKFTASVDKYSRKLVLFGTAVTGAMVGIIAKTVSAAAGVEELQNRIHVTFKQGAPKVKAWAKEFADAVGRSRFAMEGLATQFGVLLTAFGMSQDEVLRTSIALGELTTNWESFMDLPASEVIAKVSSGLAGEAEALRRVGVDVSAVAVKQELLNRGFTKGIEAATQLEKVQARLAIILRGLPDAQGDAARTSQELTNQWRAMQGALKDLTVELGEKFAPLAKDVIGKMTGLLKAAREFAESQPEVVEQIGKTGLGMGGVALGVGALGVAFVKAKALVIAFAASTAGLVIGLVAAGAAAFTGAFKLAEWWDRIGKLDEAERNFLKTLELRTGITKELAKAQEEMLGSFAGIENAIAILDLLLDKGRISWQDYTEGLVKLLKAHDKLIAGLDNEEKAEVDRQKAMLKSLDATLDSAKATMAFEKSLEDLATQEKLLRDSWELGLKGWRAVESSVKKLTGEMFRGGSALARFRKAAKDTAHPGFIKWVDDLTAKWKEWATGGLAISVQQLGEMRARLKEITGDYAALAEAQKSFSDSVSGMVEQLEPERAFDPREFESRFDEIKREVGTLLPEVQAGSATAIAEVDNLLGELAESGQEYAREIAGMATTVAEEFPFQFHELFGRPLAESAEVATELYEGTLNQLRSFIEQAGAATELAAEGAKESMEKETKDIGKQIEELEKRILALKKSMEDLTITADNKDAMAAINEVIQGLKEATKLAAGITLGAGAGAGTPTEDRLSTSRRPRHPGRSESITTNVNAAINIARSGTPSSLAKSVASEIGRMKRRGHRVG